VPPQADMFAEALPKLKYGTTVGLTIQEAFDEFHRRNPHVYVMLSKMARAAKAAGRTKIGIGMLVEVIRWDYLVNTDHDESDFKINNNHRSRYARLLEQQEPELAGMFETRKLRS